MPSDRERTHRLHCAFQHNYPHRQHCILEDSITERTYAKAVPTFKPTTFTSDIQDQPQYIYLFYYLTILYQCIIMRNSKTNRESVPHVVEQRGNGKF